MSLFWDGGKAFGNGRVWIKEDDSYDKESKNELKNLLKHILNEDSFFGVESQISVSALTGSQCLLPEEAILKCKEPIKAKEPEYRFYWTNTGLMREAIDTGIYSLPDPPDGLRPTQKIMTLSQAFHTDNKPDTNTFSLNKDSQTNLQ